jgi:hypothetical protein
VGLRLAPKFALERSKLGGNRVDATVDLVASGINDPLCRLPQPAVLFSKCFVSLVVFHVGTPLPVVVTLLRPGVMGKTLKSFTARDSTTIGGRA